MILKLWFIFLIAHHFVVIKRIRDFHNVLVNSSNTYRQTSLFCNKHESPLESQFYHFILFIPSNWECTWVNTRTTAAGFLQLKVVEKVIQVGLKLTNQTSYLRCFRFPLMIGFPFSLLWKYFMVRRLCTWLLCYLNGIHLLHLCIPKRAWFSFVLTIRHFKRKHSLLISWKNWVWRDIPLAIISCMGGSG